MIAPLFLSILPPLTLSLLLVGLWGPGPHLFRSHLLLKVCLAVGLALGISSCSYFGWLLIGGPSRMGLIISELVTFTTAMGLLFHSLRKRAARGESGSFSAPMPN